MTVQTATNPKTGERVAFIDGRWVPFSQSATNPKTGAKAYLVNGQWVVDQQVATQPTQPETTTNPFMGMVARGAELLGSGVELAARAGESIGDFIAEKAPALDTRAVIDEKGARIERPTIEQIRGENQMQYMFDWANSLRQWGREINYQPSTQLEDLADNPLTAVPFIVERVISSSPDMIAAAGATVPYIATRANEILNERLANDNKELKEATVADVAAATGAAIVEGTLERIATGRLIKKGAEAATGAGRIGKEAGVQAGTEAIEETGAYAGATVGTEAGFDPRTAARTALEAAIVGGGLGAGVQGVRELVTSKTPPVEPPPITSTTEVPPPPAGPATPPSDVTVSGEIATAEQLLNQPPKVLAEDAPENVRYEPTTLNEDQVNEEIDKLEDIQEQLATLLFDTEGLNQRAALARIPVATLRQNIQTDFDNNATRLDVFYKHLDGTLPPVKPTVTQDQVVAAGVSPDVAKALNVQPNVTPTAPIVPGATDATATTTPPTTQPSVAGTVGGGAAVPPLGLTPQRQITPETPVEGLEPTARTPSDVVSGEGRVEPALDTAAPVDRTQEYISNLQQTFAGVDQILQELGQERQQAEVTQAAQTRRQETPRLPKRVQYKAEGPAFEQGLRFHYNGLNFELSASSGMLGRPVLNVYKGKADYLVGDHYANNERGQVDGRVGDARQIGQYNLPPNITNAINNYLFSYSKGDAGVAAAGKQVADAVNTEMAKYETSAPSAQRRPAKKTAEELEREEMAQFLSDEAETMYSTASYEAEPKPNGPFTGAKSNVVTTDGVDPRFKKLLEGLMKTLGMGDVRVFLATKKDILPPVYTRSEAIRELKTKYGLSDQYAINAILPDVGKKSVSGIMSQWGDTKDFIIVYDSSRTLEQNIETIGHELGHIVETVAYRDASSEVRNEIQTEYEKWFRENKGKTARDIMRATRNRVTAQEAIIYPPDYKFQGKDLEYWTSFSEWFADNVSKWATTNQKPMTVVQKFFADVARKIRKLVAELTGNKFIPNKAVAKFLDSMGPPDIATWLKSDSMPGMNTNYMLNAVGNRVKNLPPLTKDVYETVRNILDSTTIKDNIRKGLYAFLSLPQQVQLFAKELPSLRDLLNVINVRASSLKDRKEVLDRNIRKWNNVLSKYALDARQKFYEIAHESTRLQVDFKNPTKEDLADPEKAKLIKEFNALKPDLQSVYYDMLESYRKMADEYLKLLSKNLSPRLVRRLERKMAQKRLKVYLPLFREGDYWLRYETVINGKQETVVRSFKSNREREMAIEEAVASGNASRASMQPFSRVEGSFKKAGAGSFFFNVMEELDKKGASPALKRSLFEMYLDLIPAQSVRQQYRTRDGYRGYESDLMNVYATVASRMANQLTNLEFIPEIDKVYSDVQKEADKGAAQSKDNAINALMGNLDSQMEYLRDPGNSTLVNTLSSFSYYWYIIGNVSTALINLTQLPMVVYPMLAGKYGNVDTSKAMIDAQKQYFKGGWDNDNVPGGEKKFPADYSFGIGLPSNSPLKKLFDAAVRQSAIRRSSGYDVIEGRKKNYGMGDYIGLKAKTEQILGWTFQNSERYNREVTLIAAFNLEMKKNGGNIDNAIKTAIDFINETHGTTLTETSPRVFQTGFGKVAFTFKNFAQTMIYLQTKLLRDALKGETPEVKKLAAKQFLGISALAFTFAGVQGMPFFGAATVMADILQDILGDDDEPWRAEAVVRSAVGAIPNKGPVNELLMMDLASRTGFANLLWKDDDKRVEEVGPILFAMEQIFGPAYAAGMGMFRGYKDYKEGHYDRAVEAVTPSFVRNSLKTYRYASEGALTRDKEIVYDNFNKYELFMQVLGFTPVEVARRTEVVGDFAKKTSDLQDRKEALLNRLYLARISEDKEGVKEVKEAIDKFNESKAVKERRMRITPSTIMSSYDTRRKRGAQSTFGIYVPPKMRKISEEELKVEKPLLKRIFGEEEKKD